jgi:Raf kinase inhibitor-like YbhB/YbcL family protein
MGLAHDAVAAVGSALNSVRAGEDKLASSKLQVSSASMLSVSSPDFEPGERLPRWATADGDGRAPRLMWSGVPAGAGSIVVMCEDPDAPFPQPFLHHLIYAIPPTVNAIDGDAKTFGHEGKNSKLATGFTPASPPPGHGVHHYHFQVFALDRPLALEPGAGREAVIEAMSGHVMAFGELVGVYERK